MKKKILSKQKKKKDDEGKRNQNFFLVVCLSHSQRLSNSHCKSPFSVLFVDDVCLFVFCPKLFPAEKKKSEIRNQKSTSNTEKKNFFSFLLFLSLPLMCTKLVSCIFLTTIYPFNNYGETVFLKRVHD